MNKAKLGVSLETHQSFWMDLEGSAQSKCWFVGISHFALELRRKAETKYVSPAFGQGLNGKNCSVTTTSPRIVPWLGITLQLLKMCPTLMLACGYIAAKKRLMTTGSTYCGSFFDVEISADVRPPSTVSRRHVYAIDESKGNHTRVSQLLCYLYRGIAKAWRLLQEPVDHMADFQRERSVLFTIIDGQLRALDAKSPSSVSSPSLHDTWQLLNVVRRNSLEHFFLTCTMHTSSANIATPPGITLTPALFMNAVLFTSVNMIQRCRGGGISNVMHGCRDSDRGGASWK